MTIVPSFLVVASCTSFVSRSFRTSFAPGMSAPAESVTVTFREPVDRSCAPDRTPTETSARRIAAIQTTAVRRPELSDLPRSNSLRARKPRGITKTAIRELPKDANRDAVNLIPPLLKKEHQNSREPFKHSPRWLTSPLKNCPALVLGLILYSTAYPMSTAVLQKFVVSRPIIYPAGFASSRKRWPWSA